MTEKTNSKTADSSPTLSLIKCKQIKHSNQKPVIGRLDQTLCYLQETHYRFKGRLTQSIQMQGETVTKETQTSIRTFYDGKSLIHYEDITIINMLLLLLVTQWCLTLCDPMDYGLAGSSVRGILQARWVAISFSKL